MNNLGPIIDKIKCDKGFDLSGYREITLQRRIQRRIKFDGAKSLDEYMRMIDRDYHLYWRLISDFFIGVTDFFRDREIWDIVCKKVLPEIFVRRSSFVNCESSNEPRITNHESRIKLPIRIWSAGCSTGEETYSLAMMIREIYEKEGINGLPVFIHGTDILEDKLELAKQGIYPREKVKNIEQGLIEKYFTPRAANYQLQPTIRFMTRFKKLDLAHPSKFLGFDMIVCRNVLIYFQRKLQEKVLKYFHKALRPQGILWLGKSESLWGQAETMFKPVFKKERIFRKL